jgi:hypothetical protein
MTTYANPPEHDPDQDAVAFGGRPARPGRLRIGLVGGAAMLLAVGVVATSMAASPAPEARDGNAPAVGDAYGPAAIAPGFGEANDLPTFDHGRFDGPRRGDITITAISGSNLTLGTDDGWRRTIAVTDAVDITRGGQDVDVAALKVGDHVRFAQTRDDDGTYTVTRLAVVVPTNRGTVSDVTSSGFKVTTRGGAVWTVGVSGSTEYRFGPGDGTLADVTNGAVVVVAGESAGDDALTALSVRVRADQATGIVTAKTADTLTLTKRDGSTTTVHVDADTTYRVRGAAGMTASLADVTVDMAVGVSGRARADGSIDADLVVGRTGKGRFGGGPRLELRRQRNDGPIPTSAT